MKNDIVYLSEYLVIDFLYFIRIVLLYVILVNWFIIIIIKKLVYFYIYF